VAWWGLKTPKKRKKKKSPSIGEAGIAKHHKGKTRSHLKSLQLSLLVKEENPVLPLAGDFFFF
jgi:hypothetical protein